MSIRVLLVDDHTMVRQALRGLVENEGGMSVVAEAGNGHEALALADELVPDLVIMDVGLPGMDGIEATKRLLAAHPATKVLALSAYVDRRFVLGMLEAGAAGYIIKAETGEELLKAIHTVMNGLAYLCPLISTTLVETLRGRSRAEKQSLTRREQQVLQGLAEGLNSLEIGLSLHMAPATVEVHRRNIKRKLGMHSIADLTRYAIREGMISLT